MDCEFYLGALLKKRIGLVLSRNWAGFIVQTWQPCLQTIISQRLEVDPLAFIYFYLHPSNHLNTHATINTVAATQINLEQLRTP